MKLIIDTSKWLCGAIEVRKGRMMGHLFGSYLLRRGDNKMCCLGFYLKQCGVPEDFLRGVATPGALIHSEVPPWLRPEDSGYSDASELMKINDGPGGPNSKKKQAKIAEVFARHDVEVEFV